MKKDDDDEESFIKEEYEADIQKIVKNTNVDRPIKELTKENIELKCEINKLQDQLNAMRVMIEKYTFQSDRIHDAEYVK